MSHALLSPSSAHRWMHCPPSARLEEQFPSTTSKYAEEGTLAHAISELMLRKYITPMSAKKYNSELKKLQKHELYSEEMLPFCTNYTDNVKEYISAAKYKSSDAIVLLEEKLDFSNYVPEGNGTGDVVIIADGILQIIDLKYGKGVQVSAENNPQLRLYALGALEKYDLLYDIQEVETKIMQPRIDNISSEILKVEDLVEWGEKTVIPAAELAWTGKGDYAPGDHCKFCKAKAVCRTRAENNMELAKHEFIDPYLLDDSEIADILSKLDELTSWANAVKEYAFEQALSGKKFFGWKLVEGKSNRKYGDEELVASTLKDEGYGDEIYNRSLLGITAMEKLLGKQKFDDILAGYLIKPTGKPTLVPATDKRPELNSKASAMEDFKD